MQGNKIINPISLKKIFTDLVRVLNQMEPNNTHLWGQERGRSFDLSNAALRDAHQKATKLVEEIESLRDRSYQLKLGAKDFFNKLEFIETEIKSILQAVKKSDAYYKNRIIPRIEDSLHCFNSYKVVYENSYKTCMKTPTFFDEQSASKKPHTPPLQKIIKLVSKLSVITKDSNSYVPGEVDSLIKKLNLKLNTNTILNVELLKEIEKLEKETRSTWAQVNLFAKDSPINNILFEISEALQTIEQTIKRELVKETISIQI